MIARVSATALLATLMITALPVAAQPARPDTEFCARIRKQDPGGICSPKGEYVTAEKVYLPDGRIVNRTTGN